MRLLIRNVSGGQVVTPFGRLQLGHHTLREVTPQGFLAIVDQLDALVTATSIAYELGVAELEEFGDPADEDVRDLARAHVDDNAGQVHWGDTGFAWNPASVADGAFLSTDVEVYGVDPGDRVLVATDAVLTDGTFLVATVTAADTVRVTLFNFSGGAVDMASMGLSFQVFKG